MKRMIALSLAAASLLTLAACGDSGLDERTTEPADGQTTGSTEPDPGFDRDPTPQTGSGGEQQGSTPDGTTTAPPAD